MSEEAADADPTRRFEAGFPLPVLSAIRLVLSAERLAKAARTLIAFREADIGLALCGDELGTLHERLRIALIAYDAAKKAAITPEEKGVT